MMTWMTAMSLFDSAEALATDQLAQARRESEALFYELVFDEFDDDLGKAPAPLRMMWTGYETALAGYSIACSAILVGRGIATSQQALELSNTIEDLRRGGDPAPLEIPPWLSDTDVLSSHRSNLLRRWPDNYSWRRIPANMPYLWPVVDGDGEYELRLSKYDKELLASGERKLDKKIMERVTNA